MRVPLGCGGSGGDTGVADATGAAGLTTGGIGTKIGVGITGFAITTESGMGTGGGAGGVWAGLPVKAGALGWEWEAAGGTDGGSVADAAGDGGTGAGCCTTTMGASGARRSGTGCTCNHSAICY